MMCLSFIFEMVNPMRRIATSMSREILVIISQRRLRFSFLNSQDCPFISLWTFDGSSILPCPHASPSRQGIQIPPDDRFSVKQGQDRPDREKGAEGNRIFEILSLQDH